MAIRVPPNGFQGQASQSVAAQRILSGKKKTTRKKKRVTRGPTKRKPSKTRKRTRSRAGSKPAHMVKGSPAAKRHMAKLRRMRGKK